MKRKKAEKKLAKLFNLPGFYDEQWKAVKRLLAGERVLMIQRTGFGKSLVYQFTAMMLPGTTIIFSPLIALMRDQVDKLDALGIPAAYINSTLTPEEKQSRLRDARRGVYKMLYIAPERQEDNAWQETVQNLQIGMIVVDEAHCISAWGHDFRPSYRRIVNLVRQLQADFPVLACTATATERVQGDIQTQLDNSKLTLIRGDLSRSNFELNVIRTRNQEDKMWHLLHLVRSLEGSGVIYCGTQVESEIFAKWLEFAGINSTYYNAGLDNETRKSIEAGLMNNKYKCVVSTNALGMGIDKPDIRFVVHTQIPVSPLHYYQEIGRAGRDGGSTTIVIYYSEEDDKLPLSFIHNARPSVLDYNKIISALKEVPLGLYAVIKKVNMKKTKVNVILNDLMDQGIVVKNTSTRSPKYEYRFNAPKLNHERYSRLQEAKLADFEMMKGYINSEECRMKFLRNYLGDVSSEACSKCDIDLRKQETARCSEVGKEKIREFRESNFPVLNVSTERNILVDGVAASYYGVTNVGAALHRSKYEGKGDFPDHLLKLTLKAFRKRWGKEIFDLILYVPPTESGDLVKNFAHKLAGVLEFPISDCLIKTRQTKAQKVFESAISKKENLIGAFNILEDVEGKKILLIDDIFDSGQTVKTIGSMLQAKGASEVAPLTIAKTVGGR